MAFAIKLDISSNAAELLQRLPDFARLDAAHELIGRGETNLLKGHFYGLNSTRANALGGKRTHFYSGAAKSTQHQVIADGVIVSVNKQGMRQRLEGGEIKPTAGHKYLTIPARAEAYGKRAREFDNLRFIPTRRGGLLVEAEATRLRKTKKGFKSGGKTGGLVMYWLVPSVKQSPDPSVLPTIDALAAAALTALGSYIDRQLAKN